MSSSFDDDDDNGNDDKQPVQEDRYLQTLAWQLYLISECSCCDEFVSAIKIGLFCILLERYNEWM